MSNAQQDLADARRAREDRERVIGSAIYISDLANAVSTSVNLGGDGRVMIGDDVVLRPVADWRGEMRDGHRVLVLYLGPGAARMMPGDDEDAMPGYGRWQAAENIVRAVTWILENRSPADAPDGFRLALASLGFELERWQTETGDAATLDAIKAAVDDWDGYHSGFRDVLRNIAGILKANGRAVEPTWAWGA